MKEKCKNCVRNNTDLRDDPTQKLRINHSHPSTECYKNLLFILSTGWNSSVLMPPSKMLVYARNTFLVVLYILIKFKLSARQRTQ